MGSGGECLFRGGEMRVWIVPFVCTLVSKLTRTSRVPATTEGNRVFSLALYIM